MPSSLDELGISCPRYGKFYVCQDKPTRFIGCCTVNPCTTSDGVCPDRNLEPTTFDFKAYEKILAQECVDGTNKAAWYTCRDSSPPFMGCCAQNACQPAGCPVGMIRAAKLNSNEKYAAPFLTHASETATASSTSTATSLSTSVTTESTAVVSQTMIPDNTSKASSGSGLKKGEIAGIAAAGGAIGAILLALAIWCVFSRRKQKKQSLLLTKEGHAVEELPGDSPSGQSQETKQFSVYTMQAALPGNSGVAYGQGSPSLQQHQQHFSMISELPGTPSQRSINSASGRNIVSMSSFSGLQQQQQGRESEVSSFTVSNHHHQQQYPQQSPQLHQTPLFELEDSSHRFLKEQPGHA